MLGIAKGRPLGGLLFIVGAAGLVIVAATGRAQDGEGPLAVRVQNAAVPPGGSYFQPMNRETNTIPLYSFDKTRYTVDNKSAANVTIASITVTPLEDGQPEEWRIRDASNVQQLELEVKDQVVPKGEAWDFIIEFYPVRGDERSAQVTLTYGDGQTYTWTVRGKGRPKETRFSEHIEGVWARALGGDITDEMPTGCVADEAGNLYVSGNVAQVINKFNHDIFVGRINADGSLGWLKGWSGHHQDYQRDPGQNAETGGAADAIAYADGHVYLAISHSPTKSNSTYFSTVVKVAAETGEVVWQKAWGPPRTVDMARKSSEAYGLDVHEGRVYVTGVVEDNAKVLFLALDAGSGEVAYQKGIEVAAGSNDRGYVVAADGQGGAYVGGLTNGRGLLIHLKGVAGEAPELDWVKKISMGIGSNVNDIDVDAEGNAYLSCDRRGAQTAFSVMRVGLDGAVAWSKTFNAKDRGQKNNIHVVRVIGDHVYAGGRAAVAWHDTQFGDGYLVRLDRSSGEPQWAAFYYGGKGAEEMAEHRIKGIEIGPEGDLLLAGQVYTNPNNHTQFWGHWYGVDPQAADYTKYSEEDLTEASALTEAPEGFDAQDAAGLESFNGWIDLTGGEPLEEGNGVLRHGPLRDNEGNGPDGDLFVMRLRLKD